MDLKERSSLRTVSPESPGPAALSGGYSLYQHSCGPSGRQHLLFIAVGAQAVFEAEDPLFAQSL